MRLNLIISKLIHGGNTRQSNAVSCRQVRIDKYIKQTTSEGETSLKFGPIDKV